MRAPLIVALAFSWMPAAEPLAKPAIAPPSLKPTPLVVTPAPGGPLATFTDKEGLHAIRFSLKDAPPSKVEDARGRLLRVDHEVTKAGELAPALVWTAKDFVLDCPFDVTLELIDGSIRVTDLDADGTSEVAFAYALSCKSDVSPDDMKLLMYEGTTKYALRGTRATFAGAVDNAGKPVAVGGGEPTPDPAFNTAPKAFLAHALESWRALQPTQ